MPDFESLAKKSTELAITIHKLDQLTKELVEYSNEIQNIANRLKEKENERSG